jgi:voltage-gated potassium channel Kch
MAEKPGFRERLRYWFDNSFAGGPLVLIGWLALVTLIVIMIAAAIVSAGGIRLAPQGYGQQMTFFEAAWESLMRTFDAGTMGGDVGWGFRFVMLFVTVCGIFVVSTLIGVLTTGVEGKLDELRKGRSRVIENGHTLILGWSPQIFTILSELMIANENQKNARIVILADKDKVEMEDEVRARVETRGGTRIICRSGNPIDLTDLEIGSPHAARAIIILPPESDDPDSAVIKTILALTNNPNRRQEVYHIVTQIRDPKNMEVVRMVGGRDRVQAVLAGDLIARVVAQTSRQSGLSVVYTELLNFDGDEIYFREEPALVGRAFGEALTAYEDSTVMGMRTAQGKISLNPPMDTRLEPGDQVFALSADDDTLRLSGLASIPVDERAMVKGGKARKAAPEKALILGWNRAAAIIVRELDAYVALGSRLSVVADVWASPEVATAGQEVKECARGLRNQKVTFARGDTTDRPLLDRLKIADYDHVIVLSYAGLELQEADARTLVTLLHLRDIAERDATPFSIVSEMLDLRNRELAEVAHVDDFIVSDHLVSLMMAQLSENGALYDVFADIFDPEGSEIYLKPIGDYVQTGLPVNFYTLVAAARVRDEIVIGYRLAHEANDKACSYGVHTNPKKSDLVTFAPEDKIIVVAED